MDLSYTPPVQHFLDLVEKKPEKIFLSQAKGHSWIHYSRKDVLDRALQITGYMQKSGLQPGDKVAIHSKNCAHWMICDLAIMMGGFVSVPIYPNLNKDSLEYILKHSDTKLSFVGQVHGWKNICDSYPDSIQKIALPEGGPNDLPSLDELVEGHKGELIEPKNDQLATIIYTSGTTGYPKGVMHNYISFSASGTEGIKWLKIDENTRFFSYLPLSHVGERVSVETQALYCGGQVYFCENLDTFAKNIADARPTMFFSVPRLWLKFYEKITKEIPEQKLKWLLRIPGVKGVVQKNLLAKLGLDKAVHIFTGSAATPSHLFHFFHKLGITLQEAYGMSENFAYSHLNIFEKVKLGSVGIPYPQVKCRIGENHEVQIWSPANMVGYYKNDEATAEAFTSDGYLKTGDQGRIDDDGFLFITGRVKELFKTSKGKYVSPTPIEDKFFQEDLFEQVCVMGDGFPQPFAVVKLAQDLEDMDSELNERIKKINKTLDSHERIAKICVINDSWTVENGFLTPTLKIKRSIIEKHYAGYFDHWMTQKSVVVYQR